MRRSVLLPLALGFGALSFFIAVSCSSSGTGTGSENQGGEETAGGAGGLASDRSGGRVGTGGANVADGSGGTSTGGSGGSLAFGGSSGTDGGTSKDAPSAATPDGPEAQVGRVAVLTSRYDNARTGANTVETVLNTTNVNANSFGLLFKRPYDGNPYAQPLYVPGLTINGAQHNVVFVATSTNYVYAFDADDPAAVMPLWQRQLAPPGEIRVAGANPNTIPGQTWCHDMHPFVGITGTPVIDLAMGRMYLVQKEGKIGQAYTNKLHALDILTGMDVPGSPVVIEAAAGGQTMDAWKHLNRAGLLLENGRLYIGFASHCDDRPYHGWVLSYDPVTLKQNGVFNTSPGGQMAAVWQSGAGLAGNDKGVFFSVGNGTWTADGKNVGESVVRLNPDTTLGDWFTPANADALNSRDLDLTAGVLLVPNTSLLFSGGKEGLLYVIDQMQMTHHNATDMIVQKLLVGDQAAESAHIHTMAFWNDRLYVWPENSGLQVFSFTNGKLSTTPVATFNGYKAKHPGGIFSISADGAKPSSGIIWGTLGTSGNAWGGIAVGTLVAVDAMKGTKLWDSTGAGDTLGNFAKFSNPTVANGKVYVTTFAKEMATSPAYLNVYGLKK